MPLRAPLLSSLPLFCACTAAVPQDSTTPSPSAITTFATDGEAAIVLAEDLHPLLREVAATYSRWALVDNTVGLAGADCTVGIRSGIRLGTADRSAAHADKVFLLYAYDVAGYRRAVGAVHEDLGSHRSEPRIASRSDVLQVVVKESFAAVPRVPGPGPESHEDAYSRGERTGLFVLAKLADAPPGTDEGWIYGTVSPSGDVVDAGVIEPCVGCHRQQPERLFGLPALE